MGLFDDTTTRAMIQALGASATGVYSGTGETIYVDFRNEFEAASLFGGEVASSSPVAFVVTSDVSSPAINETLVIGGTTYYITAWHPDGEGMTMLVLSKDAVV